MGSNVTATIGSAVTAQGSNSGGILRFTAQGGDGGPGQGDHTGSPGVGGTGGGGGAVWVQMDSSITSTDPGSPGLYMLSLGGSSSMSSRGGSDGFCGPESGNAGGSNAVTASIGGTIRTVGPGASINGIGGAGGNGVGDSGGVSESEARSGGNGGSSVLTVQATVTGSIQSSAGDGIDVLAAGGAGGRAALRMTLRAPPPAAMAATAARRPWRS